MRFLKALFWLAVGASLECLVLLVLSGIYPDILYWLFGDLQEC